ncbi:MAG TPA: sigma-70 family RNA polymerase sigma factor [Kofleriaceae bacterium]|nr:sigma-70 family RNA polymerase sigma factor [Kofleriaceae bacterium]
MRPNASTSATAPSAAELDALVARAAAGDQIAFAALYRLHAASIHGLITRLVGPGSEREDLLQEVFVRFHRALPSYRREAAPATFLHGITVRVAIDHLRARRRRPDLVSRGESARGDHARSDDDPDEIAALVDPSLSAEQRVALRADVERALAFLDRLSPKQRIAFVLREVLDHSYAEIAQLMDSFETTARMRVAAAARALAKLQPAGPEPASLATPRRSP